MEELPVGKGKTIGNRESLSARISEISGKQKSKGGKLRGIGNPLPVIGEGRMEYWKDGRIAGRQGKTIDDRENLSAKICAICGKHKRWEVGSTKLEEGGKLEGWKQSVDR